MTTAAAAAARSVFRSTSVRNAAARVASKSKSSSSHFPSPNPSRNPLSHRIFRCPVEMGACLETMQPFHSVTASALMTSMLTLSQNGYGWLPEGIQRSVIGLFLTFFFHDFQALTRLDEVQESKME